MREEEKQISAAYSSIFDSFLSRPDEAALVKGYELGRKAVEEHLGLLQIVDIYHKALNENLKRLSPESANMVVKFGELLSAGLAPFEMTHQGYQESVTNLQRLNRELELRTAELAAKNEELQAFSYSVSHDLRSPLRAISGFTKILLKDHAAEFSDETKTLFARVMAAVEQMSQLIEGLLLLAQIGRKELAYDEINLTEMVQQILTELQEATPERKVSVSVAAGAQVKGDASLVRAAMTNLLSNAWKFTAKKADAKIEFGMMSYEGKPVYYVKDNGAGFNMAYADKLFGAFQRLHAKEEFPGTGVGLATVQRIIRRHNGRIWVEAEEGKGATFYFLL